MTLYLCFIFPLSKCQEIKSVICQKSGFQNHTHHLLTKNYFSCNRCQVIPRNISTEAHWDSYVNAMFNNLVREHCHLCKCFLKSLIINVYVVAINDEHSWGFCWDKHDLFKQITPQKHRFQHIFLFLRVVLFVCFCPTDVCLGPGQPTPHFLATMVIQSICFQLFGTDIWITL